MSKSQKLSIAITASLLVALIIAFVPYTLAWYESRVESRNDFILEADKFLVIFFNTDLTADETILKPAVSYTGAIKDGNIIYGDSINVLATSSGKIQTAATVAHYTAKLQYINPTKDTITEPANLIANWSAKAILPDKTEISLDLDHDITIALSATFDYRSDTLDSYNTTSTITKDTAFRVEGDCVIDLDLSAYFTQIDEFCMPYIFEAKEITISLEFTAVKLS